MTADRTAPDYGELIGGIDLFAHLDTPSSPRSGSSPSSRSGTCWASC